MHNVVVLKAPYNMQDGIGLADIGQKLIAQSLAFAGSSNQSRDVNKLDSGRQDPLGMHNLGQLSKPRIRHFDNAHIGLNGAEWVVLSSNSCLSKRIKQRRFAHIGQANDAALKCHSIP